MNEIVARKKTGLWIVWGLLLSLGAGFSAFGAVSVVWTIEDFHYLALSVFVFIAGGACFVLGVIELVRFCKTPKVIISYRAGIVLPLFQLPRRRDFADFVKTFALYKRARNCFPLSERDVASLGRGSSVCRLLRCRFGRGAKAVVGVKTTESRKIVWQIYALCFAGKR